MKIKHELLRKGLILSAIFFLVVLVSCKEEGELVPEFNSALLNLKDTSIKVTSVTIIADSVRTDRVSRSMFGKLNDQLFGLSSAEFYTQIYMPSEALNTTSIAPEDIDSVVLQLAYDGSYGYPNTSQQIYVYELEEDLNDSSTVEYFSTSSAMTDGTPLGFATISVNPTDTIKDSAPQVVRIRLDIELGQRMAGLQFNSQDEWIEFFKGVKVSPGQTDPSQGEGAIVYFNLLNSRTKLHVYYKKEDTTSVFSFLVESASQRFAHFDHNHQGSELLTSVDNANDEVNYLSSLAGSNIKLSFNDLEKLSAELGAIAINKAELIVPFEDQIISEYVAPSKTVLIYKDDSEDWILPIDWYKNGSDYFGGTLDLKNKEYRFNLASTLHEMINLGDYNRELVLTISGNSVTANRLVMNSGVKNAVNKREIYLHLTYTKQE